MTSHLTAQKVRSRLLAICLGGGLALLGVAVYIGWAGPARVPTLTSERLDAAHQKWQQTGISDYAISVKVSGRQPGLYRVTVSDGAAQSASLDGRPLRDQRTFGTWSVTGMFETMRRDVRNSEEHGYLLLHAEFDPDQGIPQQYERIEVRTGAHDALRWEVVGFNTHDRSNGEYTQ